MQPIIHNQKTYFKISDIGKYALLNGQLNRFAQVITSASRGGVDLSDYVVDAKDIEQKGRAKYLAIEGLDQFNKLCRNVSGDKFAVEICEALVKPLEEENEYRKKYCTVVSQTLHNDSKRFTTIAQTTKECATSVQSISQPLHKEQPSVQQCETNVESIAQNENQTFVSVQNTITIAEPQKEESAVKEIAIEPAKDEIIEIIEVVEPVKEIIQQKEKTPKNKTKKAKKRNKRKRNKNENKKRTKGSEIIEPENTPTEKVTIESEKLIEEDKASEVVVDNDIQTAVESNQPIEEGIYAIKSFATEWKWLVSFGKYGRIGFGLLLAAMSIKYINQIAGNIFGNGWTGWAVALAVAFIWEFAIKGFILNKATLYIFKTWLYYLRKESIKLMLVMVLILTSLAGVSLFGDGIMTFNGAGKWLSVVNYSEDGEEELIEPVISPLVADYTKKLETTLADIKALPKAWTQTGESKGIAFKESAEFYAAEITRLQSEYNTAKEKYNTAKEKKDTETGTEKDTDSMNLAYCSLLFQALLLFCIVLPHWYDAMVQAQNEKLIQ